MAHDPTPPAAPLIQRIGCFVLTLVLCVTCYACFCSDYTPVVPRAFLLLPAVGYALVLFLLYHLFRRISAALEHHFVLGVAGAAVLYFAGMIVAAWQLRFVPAFDMSAVYDGAIAWGVHGDLCSLQSATTDGGTYFYYFPNNLGATALLALWFRLCSLLGLQDYYLCACVLNALFLAFAFVLTALTGRLLGGTVCGAVAGAAFLLFPPLWFGAAVFYTDFLSIPFPIMTVFLTLTGLKQRGTRRIISYVLAGLALGIGCLIKMTVLICLVALLLCLAVRRSGKAFALLAVCGALGVSLCNAALNACVYPAQLDPETTDSMSTPVWHWVMMSLAPDGNGTYRPEDYEFTRSFPTLSQRSEADRTEALARLKRMGISGFGALAMRKTQVCWGDGTLNLGEMLDDTPLCPGTLHELLLSDGASYPCYRTLCDGILFCCLIMAALQCLGGIWGRRDASWYIAPLCVVGLALFLLFWETNARYITNFMPLLLLCAAQFPCSAAKASAAPAPHQQI